MQNDLNLNKEASLAGQEVLVFDRVGKVYRPGHELALHDVSFSIKGGEFVCLVGPSGGGKTTVLKIMAGIEEPTSGKIIRPNNVSMVFQSAALLPWLDVFDNVALVLRVKNIPEHEVKKISMKFIEMMGLGELIKKRPAELSGGQRQRVGIARALAVDPEVLLLDEPFSALDAKTTAELHDDIIKIWEGTGKTIVMVSHLIEEAVSLAERVILIKNYSIEKIFNIALAYPRREQYTDFSRQVMEIRKEFFSA